MKFVLTKQKEFPDSDEINPCPELLLGQNRNRLNNLGCIRKGFVKCPLAF